jgi:hypothetical protein
MLGELWRGTANGLFREWPQVLTPDVSHCAILGVKL